MKKVIQLCIKTTPT